ncbi:hypothetical protein J1C67_14465 [Clostridium gasigenes]|nr:hypothetical protein [Clostridium gasigenes]NKF05286.1 hypothetical protein [Clostridium gasigenes]QSW18741.1 hypothetical protein J1C67_14465 [Clostridium gasigenes]
MANRTKPKQRKIMLTEEKSLELDEYLLRKKISLQNLLEEYIDKLLNEER